MHRFSTADCSFVHLDSFGFAPHPLTFQPSLCAFHQGDYAPRSAPGNHQPNSNVSRPALLDDPSLATPHPRLTAFNLRPLQYQPPSSQGRASPGLSKHGGCRQNQPTARLGPIGSAVESGRPKSDPGRPIRFWKSRFVAANLESAAKAREKRGGGRR